jgi:3-dehydroquinate dehydratase II
VTGLEALRTSERRWRIGLVNGPNLSNLGNRHPGRYGTGLSLAELEQRVVGLGELLGVSVVTFQSNYEGALLEWIHANARELDAIMVNPAGSTPYGFALRNALQDTGLPTIEVHFANPDLNGISSLFTEIVTATVQGMRKHSYTAALVGLVAMLDDGDFLGPQEYRPLM